MQFEYSGYRVKGCVGWQIDLTPRDASIPMPASTGDMAEIRIRTSQRHSGLNWLLAGVLIAMGAVAHAAFDAESSRGVDLSGRWILNEALSDDPEAMLAERQEEERHRMEKRRREIERSRPPGMPPPIDSDQASVQASEAVRRPGSRHIRQRRHDENLRRMLGITRLLVIQQSQRQMQVESVQETRRFIAGSRSQVSMPQGQLADAQVGWSGEWFVVDRQVSRGPRVEEKFRILPKTGQLEYQMTWRGNTELSGMKVRRIFDRETAEASMARPGVGPGVGPVH